MKKRHIIISLIPAILSILLILGVETVFSACAQKDDGSWMRCHEAENSVAICGAVMTVLFVLAALIKNKAVKIICDIAALAASVVSFLLPGSIIQMCMMNTMRCYTVMQPFVRIMTVITAVFAVVGIIRTFTKSHRS